jgi:hypothetical protein
VDESAHRVTAHQPQQPEHAQYDRDCIQHVYATILMTMRRFCARPSLVLFDAIGFSAP